MSAGNHHDTVIELLPWFVNGTLEDGERSFVEGHVRTCTRCYAMLQEERRLHALVAHDAPAKLSSAQHGLERLMPKLDRERGAAMRRRFGLDLQLPSQAGAVAAVAVLAAIALATFGWINLNREAGSTATQFETLTGPAVEIGARLDLVFVEDLSESQLRSLLQDNGATIVNGPTDIGRYTVRLDGTLAEAEVAELIESLRADNRVRFVGRSFMGEDD